MIITIVCICVVLLSIFAIGIPFVWLIHGRRPLSEQVWIEVPFLGIAAIVLLLQNLVYIDLPLRYTTPFLWVAALAGWAWMYRTKHITPSLAALPRAPFGIALAVYLLQGLGLILVGAKFYMGRAWGDQFNYTVIAQFLTDQRFSTSMQELGNRPYLVNAIALKWDRIGESILQGFFAVSSLQEAKTLFESTILLGPALTVLTIYALGQRFGLHRRNALATAATAGLLPAIAAIHLESFLSQMLAVPLLLLYPLLLDRLIERPNWQRFSTCAVLAAAITSIYTEFWILLLGLSLLSVVVAATRVPQTKRVFSYWFALMLAPFVLNPLFASSVLGIFGRVDGTALANIYPWALTLEGLGRLWLGDLAITPAPLQSAIRAYAVAVTGLGYYGLMQFCTSRLSAGRRTWHNPEQRRTLAFALGVLALAMLPVAIIARDSEHPYQFYKLLLSISPLLVLGIALAFQPSIATVIELPTAPIAQVRPSIYSALAIGIIFTGSVVGTTNMVLQSTTLQASERYTGDLLMAPDMQQLQQQLETLHNHNLFFYQTDRTWSTGFLNAWLTYFARDNQIWLGNQYLNGVDLSIDPTTKPITDLDILPTDTLVLNNSNIDLTSFAPDLPQPVWTNASYQLFQPTHPYWLLPLVVDNKNGLEQVDNESFLWMGQDDTVVKVLASKAGTIILNAAFGMGPSVSDQTQRTLRVTTGTGYLQYLTITNNNKFIIAPVEAGINTITLRVIDQPDITQQPNGDSRPLLLAVRGLTMRLNKDSTLIEDIKNLNGIETLNDQSFLWLGRGDTTVKVLSASAGEMRMTATFLIGPSAPELENRRVLVTTDRGYKQAFILASGKQSVALPVEAGTTSITFHILDQPSVTQQPNGDTRPLMLGMQGLEVELENNSHK